MRDLRSLARQLQPEPDEQQDNEPLDEHDLEQFDEDAPEAPEMPA